MPDPTYIAVDSRVRDDSRSRSCGLAQRLRPAQDPGWIDVLWPDGTRSTYGVDAARDFLVVEANALFDLFRLGADL